MSPVNPLLFPGEGMIMRLDNAIYCSLNGKKNNNCRAADTRIVHIYIISHPLHVKQKQKISYESLVMKPVCAGRGSNVGINKYNSWIDLTNDTLDDWEGPSGGNGRRGKKHQA